jgi:hypothetical protein
MSAAQCPHCGEWIDLFVDTGGLNRQDYVEDCSVCCRPLRVRVTLDREGDEHMIQLEDDS